LTAAGELVKHGHAVTVFEALHKPGGVLVMAFPSSACQKRSSRPKWRGWKRQE
jgi:glutamate synthase (NADPH/NADH) small chain